jgi:hypothetical protein
MTLEADTSPSLNFILRKQILDESLWQEKKRDAFYSALGFFALSVPFPIFLYGYAVDSSIAASRVTADSDTYNKFRRQAELTYGAYWATLFVSVSLFIRMLVTLVEYIEYVDYTTE